MNFPQYTCLYECFDAKSIEVTYTDMSIHTQQIFPSKFEILKTIWLEYSKGGWLRLINDEIYLAIQDNSDSKHELDQEKKICLDYENIVWNKHSNT